MGDIERSPVLTAPSFNTFLGGKSYESEVGEEEYDLQASNDLCVHYLPLALKLVGRYSNKGLSHDELKSAALLGLVRAARKFDPSRGAFGPYAKHWIRGEITGLFKPARDALTKAPTSLDSSPEFGDGEMLSLHERIADDGEPTKVVDLSATTEVESRVLIGRSQGENLQEIGNELGVSAERVRQLEKRATKKVATTPGNVARACIRDLLNRRGYQKPTRQLLPFKKQTYVGRTYSREEIDALVASRPDLGAKP